MQTSCLCAFVPLSPLSTYLRLCACLGCRLLVLCLGRFLAAQAVHQQILAGEKGDQQRPGQRRRRSSRPPRQRPTRAGPGRSARRRWHPARRPRPRPNAAAGQAARRARSQNQASSTHPAAQGAASGRTDNSAAAATAAVRPAKVSQFGRTRVGAAWPPEMPRPDANTIAKSDRPTPGDASPRPPAADRLLGSRRRWDGGHGNALDCVLHITCHLPRAPYSPRHSESVADGNARRTAARGAGRAGPDNRIGSTGPGAARPRAEPGQRPNARQARPRCAARVGQQAQRQPQQLPAEVQRMPQVLPLEQQRVGSAKWSQPARPNAGAKLAMPK